MKYGISILSITGSDSTGQGGMQADVKTISELGGHALSAVTSVTTQGQLGLQHIYNLPQKIVVGQVKSLLEDVDPLAIKVGLVLDADTISSLGSLLSRKRNVVCAPGILASDGQRLANDTVCKAFVQHLLPISSLLVIRCGEAEILLGTKINSHEDMEIAARKLHEMGAQWVMLRGALLNKGCCTALLYSDCCSKFFSSYNIEGWQQHGVGGALSSAIATQLAFGNDMETAISKAHDYIHSQVVYAVGLDSQHLRPSDLYNQFMSLIAQHYDSSHNVAFYAGQLSISTRYLSQMTNKYVGKTPKEVIADYLLREARILLETSRLTVQEISFRLGFTSQSAFCRFFRLHEGFAPSQLRIPNKE